MIFSMRKSFYIGRFSRFVFLFILLISTQACAVACDGNGRAIASGKPLASGEEAVARAPIIENRFIANGTVTRVERKEGRVSSFWMTIDETEPVAGYENFGSSYEGDEVKVKSVIELPFKVGSNVSVVLRVAGDEYGQSLFLVLVRSG